MCVILFLPVQVHSSFMHDNPYTVWNAKGCVCACVCACTCACSEKTIAFCHPLAVTAPDHTDCVLPCLQDGSTETERAAGWWRVQTSATLATAH